MSRELAELFISYNIDDIDKENWIKFFQAFGEDHPCHVNHSTGMDILAILDECDIKYSQEAREQVLLSGIRAVIANVYEPGDEINANELYIYDEDEYMDGASSWLGYTRDEFVQLMYRNKAILPVKYIKGSNTIFEVE